MIGLIRIGKIKSKLINILSIVFLTHGFLYFFFPQDIYNITSPIRFIKYIVIFLIMLLVLNEAKTYKVFLYILTVVSLISINIIAVGKNVDYILLVNYLIPLSIFFFHEGISKYLKKDKIAITVYAIMSIFSYIEFFLFLGMFPIFADSGYRVVSIFVNPNNLGLVTVILTSYILGKKIIKSKLGVIAVFANSILIIILTGSRTSMIIFSIVIILYLLKSIFKLINKMQINLNGILFSCIVSVFLVFYSLIFQSIIQNAFQILIVNTRTLSSVDFASGRINQYLYFLDNVAHNLMFPLLNNVSYTDNLYLTIWGAFGLPMLIFFLFLNVYLLIKILFEKRAKYFILLLIFLISGLAENFIYLWPVAYFYWSLVAEILKKNSTTRLNTISKNCF